MDRRCFEFPTCEVLLLFLREKDFNIYKCLSYKKQLITALAGHFIISEINIFVKLARQFYLTVTIVQKLSMWAPMNGPHLVKL